jgi:hypothetical protein
MKKKSKNVPEFLNLVAKYAHEFNRANVYVDRTKFKRKDKHKSKSFVDFNYSY